MRLYVPAAVAAIVLPLLLAASPSANTLSHERSATAARPRVDVVDANKIVVSLDLAGGLPGTVTFNFERAADGTLAGTWAAQIAYADPTDPATGEEPSHDHSAEPHEHVAGDAPHKDFLRLVHRGAMSGVIQSAELSFDGSGVVTAMMVAFSVEQGTLEFTDAAGSTGTASLTQFTLAN